MMKKASFALVCAAIVAVCPVWAAPPAEGLVEKLAALTGVLDEGQRDEMQFSFEESSRERWNFFPMPHVGLAMRGLDTPQREAVAELLKYALSMDGYGKAEDIRFRETVLGGSYDPDAYYLAVFGEPGGEAPWMLRWEGHHLSLNWTVVGGKVQASTPQFLGANPVVIQEGAHQGQRTLTIEEELARTLAKSFDAEQAKKGIASEVAPPEILTRMQSEAERQAEEGLLFGELGEEQQGMLRKLVKEYARIQNPAIAEARMSKVEEGGWETVRFVWMGGLEPGQGHYYRVQGPEFLIEYDNTQNNANHIHSVWRDFKGDFGRDVLQLHYQQAHNAAHPMLNWNR